jgi:zinc transporter, ZIP family
MRTEPKTSAAAPGAGASAPRRREAKNDDDDVGGGGARVPPSSSSSSSSSPVVRVSAALLLLVTLVAVVRLYARQASGPSGHSLHQDASSSWADAEVVLWHAWLTAASTGLGVVPFLVNRSPSSAVLGICNGVAAGMMLAASARLALEGSEAVDGSAASAAHHHQQQLLLLRQQHLQQQQQQQQAALSLLDDPGAEVVAAVGAAGDGFAPGALLATGVVRVLLGVLLGGVFILASKRVLDAHEDLRVAGFRGLDAKKVLLILGVMTLHSATEGVGIGVSFGTQGAGGGQHGGEAAASAAAAGGGGGGGRGGDGFGEFISATLAVHNVPEGLATCLVLLPRGATLLEAAVWAVFTSLPQPLFAVPAFLSVTHFAALLPIGLGFAAGAMTWVALVELLPESAAEVGKVWAGLTTALAALAMWGVQAWMEG